ADGTGERSWRFSISVNGEVVGALVAACLFLADLEQAVVQEGRGAETEEVGRHPLDAERLVEEDEVLDGLLRVADAPRRLHADLAARLFVDVADRLEHDERDRQRRSWLDLAGRRLDEIGTGCDREQARAANVVIGAEL